MKMELDKKLDTIRLNVLAANFGDLATRRQMIQEFGDYPDALWGVNENGEKVMLSIRKNGITERVFQSNRWVRVNEYDADGCEAGETYEGRWAECPKSTAPETDEELELSDAQSARNDEIYNAAYEFCKVMAEDDDLQWNMEILGELADLAAELLTRHGSRGVLSDYEHLHHGHRRGIHRVEMRDHEGRSGDRRQVPRPCRHRHVRPRPRHRGGAG